MTRRRAVDPGPTDSECWSCLALSGEKPISPGVTIYEGRHWCVEHAYPSALLGWIVIVLRRHTESLHQLTEPEWEELGRIQRRAVTLIADSCEARKVYLVAFAEGPHFEHVHVHVVPRAENVDPGLRGVGVFAALRVDESGAVPRSEVAEWCAHLRDAW